MRFRIRYSLRSKSSAVLRCEFALDKNLLEDRFDGFRGVSDRRVIGRDIAPAKNLLSGAVAAAFENFLAPALGVIVTWHANHSDAVVAGRWQVETQFLALRLEEVVRNLNQDSGSVAGILLAAFGAAMLQIDQD